MPEGGAIEVNGQFDFAGSVILSVLIGLSIYIWYYYFHCRSSTHYPVDLSKKNAKALTAVDNKTFVTDSRAVNKRSKTSAKTFKSVSHNGDDPGLKHALFDCTLKKFTREVTCLGASVCGTKVAAASSDSSIRVYEMDPSDLKQQRTVRGTVPQGDYCTAIDISCCKHYVFGATALSCKLIKMQLPDDFSGVNAIISFISESKNSVYGTSGNVQSLSASKGKWVVTASSENNTTIHVFDYSLDLLASIDTKQVKVYTLGVAPVNGRFFGVAAWAPGIKVYEVEVQRTAPQDYKKVEKVMDLETRCGVNALAFSPDNKQALLSCKDGQLILWNIDVRYKANEDAKKLKTVNLDGGYYFSHLCYTRNARCIIGTVNKSLHFINPDSLKVVCSIEDAHPTGPIHHLCVSQEYDFFFTAALGDFQPRIWHVPTISDLTG